MIPDTSQFGDWLEDAVRRLGGLSAGCLRPESLDLPALREAFGRWNAAGNAGLLRYMDDSTGVRTDPFAARPWAKNVIVFAFAGDWGDTAKAPAFPPPAAGEPAGLISTYACGPDYHRTGHGILQRLVVELEALSGRAGFRQEAAVDTRPVPEVFLGVAAGLGVRGRNGLLRTPQRGCRVFLATLFTELELPEVRRTPAFAVSCEECGACVRNCPTGALTGDGVIRAALCRSCLSMEFRGEFSADQRRLLGDALFGCDACTACCPCAATPPGAVSGIPAGLDWILAASSGEIGRRIRGTAMDHAGAKLLKRNAAAVRENVRPG